MGNEFPWERFPDVLGTETRMKDMSTTITAEAIYAAQSPNFQDALSMEDCTGFMELLERVRTESPEASGILERMAVDPKALKKWNFVPATSLSMAFTWQQTPEGHVFWADLNASLTHMTPDPDPMTALGTSAQQATEAFQGLQEASKDLSLIHIRRCRRYTLCRSRWTPHQQKK